MFVDTHVSLVDIADCTEGHLLAAERGVPGERYVLSGATLTVRRRSSSLERLTGVNEPVRALPPAVATPPASRRDGGPAAPASTRRVCRELVRTLLHGHAYDGSRAARELGLSYTPRGGDDPADRRLVRTKSRALVPRQRRAG